MSMIRKYFEKVKEHTKAYGEKTIVLWECGSFYEVYGLKDKTGTIITPAILSFAKICDFRIANKKICVGEHNIVMAGFGNYMLDKYLKKLNDNGYTVPIYKQDIPGSNTTRSLRLISSPGTYLPDEEQHITNNIMCCWIEKYDKSILETPYILCGLSNIDIFTGKPNLFEFKREKFHDPTTFDEMERFYSIYQPSEIIFIYNHDDKKEIEEIVQFSSIKCSNIHYISLLDETNAFYKEIKNCEKQTYQEELLTFFYDIKDYDFFIDTLQLAHHPTATQSFCFLLEFVRQHNPNLVRKIHEPQLDNINHNLLLANHSLKQLHILDTSDYKTQYSSVSNLINKCKTPMGRRRLNHILLNPVTDVNYLNTEYEIVGYILDHFDNYSFIRHDFSPMRDLEKLYRKVILKIITPYELSCIYTTIKLALSIHNKIKEDKVLMKYIQDSITEDIERKGEEVLKMLDSIFNWPIAETLTSVPFDENCFKKNFSTSLDNAEQKHVENKDKLESIRSYFNTVLEKYERKTLKNPYVKINITEKSVYSLVTTNRRSMILKDKLTKKSNNNLLYSSSYNGERHTLAFSQERIQYNTAGKSNKRIDSKEIGNICSKISVSFTHLKDELKTQYKEVIERIQMYGEHIQVIVQYIILLDVLVTKAYVAKKYNYCRPVIDDSREKSFFEAKQIRHALIEHLQKNEIYVPNDISLGTQINGMLLFGTNAVGKSSLIRSIGITIILAQSGMFVPCSHLLFKPYGRLFTRILGNDNIFKGLSTFAVEMSELRTILKMSDQNSLILGDELCSGTETTSALKIFGAGIIRLSERKASFIFATHFHEITAMEEIKQLKNLALRHMTVIYNREKDSLIYERKLTEGPGNHIYGLEVCKALKLPKDFMNLALSLKTDNGILRPSILLQNQSCYNRDKIKGGICEKCGEREAVDVHHLHFQKYANSDGFIGHFHKNHKANLINICRECHNEIHKKNEQGRLLKSTNGMVLEG